MSQEALDFGRSHRVAQAYRKLLRAVSDAVDVVGLIQAAGACDARKSELNDAIQGREGRYMRVEWLLAIIDIAPPDCRRAIDEAYAGWRGALVVPAKQRTPEERLADLEALVATRFGVAGTELVEKNR